MADRVQAGGASDSTFDLEELIAALQQAERDGEPAGVTVMELVAQMRMSPQTVRRYVQAGLAAGRVRHVRVRRPRMNGVVALTDAYEWVEMASSEESSPEDDSAN